MRDTVYKTVDKRMDFRDVEEIRDTQHDWEIHVHSGSPPDEHGASYVIEIYQKETSDEIVVVSRAGISDNYRDLLHKIPDSEVVGMRASLSSLAASQGMASAPEKRNGNETFLEYAEVYSFYQSFFPDDFTPTLLSDKIQRGVSIVDYAWTLFSQKAREHNE